MSIDPTTLFSIFNYGVLPFWLLLILWPRARLTDRLVHSGLAPVALGVAYTVLLMWAIFGRGAGEPGLDFGSLAGVRAGFQSDIALLAGWVHYLAFDLFVGAWCCRDAARHDIAHLAVAPVLVFVLLAGPLGLLLYLALRALLARRFTLREA